MTLLQPLCLLALVPLAGALAWLWRRSRQDDPWASVVDPALRPHLGMPEQAAPRRGLIVAGGVLAALVVVALAGPAWDKGPPVAMRANVAPLVVALDLSRSMDAVDPAPSRLAVARVKLGRLLERLGPRPVALVAYAGSAHRVLPASEDTSLIAATLDSLSSALMPVAGSNPAAALAVAGAETGPGGDVLVMGDGADAAAAEAASTLAGAGIAVHAWGVGSAGGGPIRLPGGHFLSHDGAQVRPAMEADALLALAKAGGGAFVIAGQDDSDIERLHAALAPAASDAQATREPTERRWRDRGPWLLALLLLPAALAFRRGWMAAVTLALVLPASLAEAGTWEDLWLTRDAQGLAALEAGAPERAATLFEDPHWRGVALYRAGDFNGAAEAFAESEGAHYNQGTALLRAGRLGEARAALRRALADDPDNRDARHNLDLVERALADQPAAPSPPDRPVDPAGKVPESVGDPSRPADPYAEESVESAGLDTMDTPAPKPETGHDVEGEAGGAAIVGGEQDMGEGRTGPGTGQTAEEAPGLDEDGNTETASRPGTVPGAQAPQGRREGGRAPGAATAAPPGAPTTEEDGAPADVPEADAEATEAPASGSPPPGALPGGSGQSGRRGAGDAPSGEMGEGAQTAEPAPSAMPESPARLPEGAEAALDAQALRQWLQRVPDDPGGFLREKFRREAGTAPTLPPGGVPW